MVEISDVIQKRILILDGALGTMIFAVLVSEIYLDSKKETTTF